MMIYLLCTNEESDVLTRSILVRRGPWLSSLHVADDGSPLIRRLYSHSKVLVHKIMSLLMTYINENVI